MPVTHSVTLDKTKCRGCTNCIKHCPTEAIRVRDGKAVILHEKCIDCGECIRICPYHAKIAVTDKLSMLNEYKYKIALPAPTFYAQFKNISVSNLLSALLKIGFDEVFEVALAAQIVSAYTRKVMADKKGKLIISSACPAIVKLIQIRFPSLIDNILNLKSPMEVAAMIAKKAAAKKTGLPMRDIGVFFISPCGAKVTSAKSPVGIGRSNVSGVLSMQDVYSKVLDVLDTQDEKTRLSKGFGIGWAISGGEAYGVGTQNFISVDGIENCIKVLEEVEMGNFDDIDFIECLACTGGCVGGPLTIENCFIARNRIKNLSKTGEKNEVPDEILDMVNLKNMALTKKIEKKNVMMLDPDIEKAMQKMQKIDEVYKSLPGLDCGSCGSPNCRALAEDIVRGLSSDVDCIFNLREKVSGLAKEVLNLSVKLPPVISGNQQKGQEK